MDYTQTAIFSDLDGTLFDSHGLVSEKNREAILDSPPGADCLQSLRGGVI